MTNGSIGTKREKGINMNITLKHTTQYWILNNLVKNVAKQFSDWTNS